MEREFSRREGFIHFKNQSSATEFIDRPINLYLFKRLLDGKTKMEKEREDEDELNGWWETADNLFKIA